MKRALALVGFLFTLVPGQTFDHVTVTVDSFVSDLAPLITFLEDSLGYEDTTVTIEVIAGGYPGRDTQERLRNFIRYAYQNWGTTHVLLAGDDDILPCRRGWVDASHILQPLKDTIPTDLYFSDLDGDWDRDGDNIFGEPEDSCDFYPDVHVARMPASYAPSIELFVGKFLTYCGNPQAPYLGDILLAGFDDRNNDPPVIGEQTMEFYDSSYVPQAMRPCNKVYDSHTGNHREDVLDALNRGQHIFIHWDHGDTNAYGCGWDNHNWAIDHEDVFWLMNAPEYSLFISVGCLTGHFDGMDCILEFALGAPNGGAVAGIGNSRCGVVDARNPQRAFGALMVEGFVRPLFGHQGPARLDDFSLSRAEVAPLADTNLIYRWSLYCMNLMGDAAMPVWVPSSSAVEETVGGGWKREELRVPTVLRGPELARMDVRVTDIQGRDVTGRRHRLAPGVYFVRSIRTGAGRKVVIQ